MRPPHIPDDDAARVVALEALCLLDTGPEERFDRITRTAAALLDVPVALVNLVDDHRQWAKSAVGFDQGATDGRSTSFCAHVVGDQAPVFVPETRRDERFHDNPMVTDDPPGLGSYFGVPVRGPSGHVLGSICVADHRSRHLTEEQLAILTDLAGWVEAEFDRSTLARLSAQEQQARRRVEAITAAVGDGIVLFDTDGTVVAANPAAEALVGAEDGGLDGRHVSTLLADGSEDEGLALLLASGGLERPVQRAVTLAGHRGPMDAEVTVTSLPHEEAYVVAVRDVSARRLVERMKDEFIGTVSHELRTPLTAIKGTLALTVGGVTGDLPAEARGLLDVALENTDRLIRLVNDILDIERLAAGRVELSYTTTDLAAVARTAIGNVAPIAAEAAVPLEVDVPDVVIEVDVDRVVQALTNLLGNAIRYSPTGSPVTLGAEDLGDQVAMAVTDRGRGIPAADLERIFDRFGQVDASDGRDRSGTGLGLPIARGMAERHGGSLTVASEPGVGSRFVLTVPRRAAGAPEVKP